MITFVPPSDRRRRWHLVHICIAYIWFGWFNRIYLHGIDLQRLHLHRPHLYRLHLTKIVAEDFLLQKSFLSRCISVELVLHVCTGCTVAQWKRREKNPEWSNFILRMSSMYDDGGEEILCRTWKVSFLVAVIAKPGWDWPFAQFNSSPYKMLPLPIWEYTEHLLCFTSMLDWQESIYSWKQTIKLDLFAHGHNVKNWHFLVAKCSYWAKILYVAWASDCLLLLLLQVLGN